MLVIRLNLLEKENKDLREENTRLRDDWKKLAKEEAALSAEIQAFKDASKRNRMSIKISNLLIVNLVKIQR